MAASRFAVQHALTPAQTRLLERHERGLRRLAAELAARNGMDVTDIMITIVDPKGRIGRALTAALPASSIGPIVLPGRAIELEAWVGRLALHGPVWDFGGSSSGIPVIVIDEHDVMAVIRLPEQAS